MRPRLSNPHRLPRWLYRNAKTGSFYYRGPDPDGGQRLFVCFGPVTDLEARKRYGEITNRLPTIHTPDPLRDRSNDRRVGLVYVLRAGKAGAFKIGFTASEFNLPVRVAALQTGCPERIEVIGFRPGAGSDEYAAHCALERWRTWGEWFSPAPEVLRFVQTLVGRALQDNPGPPSGVRIAENSQ